MEFTFDEASDQTGKEISPVEAYRFNPKQPTGPKEFSFDEAKPAEQTDEVANFLHEAAAQGIHGYAAILAGLEALGPRKIGEWLGQKKFLPDWMEEQAEAQHAKTHPGLARDIGGAVGGLSTLPVYGALSELIGPVAAFAALGGIQHAPEGFGQTIKGAGVGALTGALLGPAGRLSEYGALGKLASIPAQAGVMAGTGMLEGGTSREDILKNAIMGGGFGAWGLAKQHLAMRQFYREQAQALGATDESVRPYGGYKKWLETSPEARASGIAPEPKAPAEMSFEDATSPAFREGLPDRRGNTETETRYRDMTQRVMNGEGTPEEEAAVRGSQIPDETTGLQRGAIFAMDTKGGKKVDGRKYFYIDVDALHNYNDKFGYDAGSARLKKTAELLKAILEPGREDVYKTGGDEFKGWSHNPEDLERRLAHVQAVLDQSGEGFSFGTGDTPDAARSAAEAQKKGRPIQERVNVHPEAAGPVTAPPEAGAPEVASTAAAAPQPAVTAVTPESQQPIPEIKISEEAPKKSEPYRRLGMSPQQLGASINALWDHIQSHPNGFSFDLRTGDVMASDAKKGHYIYSKWPGQGLRTDATQMSKKQLYDWVTKNARVFQDRRVFIGGWREGDRYFLDLSTSHPNREFALAEARKYNQDSLMQHPGAGVEPGAQHFIKAGGTGEWTPAQEAQAAAPHLRMEAPAPSVSVPDLAGSQPTNFVGDRMPDPKDPPARVPKTPDQMVPTKSQAEAVLSLPDLPNNILTKLATFGANAPRVIKQFGGPLFEWLYHPAQDAFGNKARLEQGIRKTISTWRDAVKAAPDIPEELKDKVSTRVGLYAVHMREGGDRILRNMGFQVIDKLSPTEMKVYQDLRTQYETLYNSINAARGLMGYDPIGKIDDYFTFIHNMHALEKSGVDVWYADPNLLTRKLNEPNFEFANSWKRSDMAVDVDAFRVFDYYARKAARYTSYAPFKAAYDALMEPFNVTNPATGRQETRGITESAPNLANYLRQWGNYVMNRQCSDPTKEMPKDLVRWWTKANQNIGKATLPFNVRTALIHLLKFRNTYAELGGRWTALGYKDMFDAKSAPDHEWLMANNKTLPSLQAYQAMSEIQEAAGQSLEEKTGLRKMTAEAGKLRDQFSKIGMAPLQFFNTISAEAALKAAYRQAVTPIAEGGKGFARRSLEALHYADDIVSKTQATAAPQDLAMMQRYPILKPFLMFQTFMVNDFNYLAHDIAGIGQPRTTAWAAELKKDAPKMIRYAIATTAIGTVFQTLLHMRSPYPAVAEAVWEGYMRGDNVGKIAVQVGKELSEPVPVLGGMIRWSTPYKTMMPAGIQEAADLGRVVSKILTLPSEFDLSKFKPEDYGAIARLLGIPGAGEVEKTYRRLKKGKGIIPAIMGTRTDVSSYGGEGDWIDRLMGAESTPQTVPQEVMDLWKTRLGK